MILAPNMQKISKHGGRNIPPLTTRKEFINKNNEKDDLRFFGDSLVRRTSIYSAGKRKEGMAGQKASPSFAGHGATLRCDVALRKLSRISDWRIASKIAGRVNNRYVFASHETSRGMSAFRLRFDDRENRPGWTKRRRRSKEKNRWRTSPWNNKFAYEIRVFLFFFFFLFERIHLSRERIYCSWIMNNSESKKSSF